MSEERDLLLKISQINRHKNQQEQHAHTGHRTSWAPARGAPYGRARGRAGRVLPPARRTRTLILNNSGPGPGPVEASPSDAGITSNDGFAQDAQALAPQNWVARNDRHKQLINPAVYEKERLARARDLENTRKLKAIRRDERERVKIQRHLQKYSRPTADQGQSHEVLIDGVAFRVSNGGSRLLKTSTSAGNTPKRAMVGGVTFLRSKHGNLYRSGVVKNKKQSSVIKKTELCKRFTGTGSVIPFQQSSIWDRSNWGVQRTATRPERKLTYILNIGSCYKGPSCAYVHDHNKVAICKDFLQNGSCPAGPSCDLSHEATPERVPACVHFLRGKCSNEQCRYAHVRVNPSAPVCRAFATLGYCDKGSGCTERHVFECPDYARNGVCPHKKCRLPHVDRAGQLRKMDASGSNASSTRPAGSTTSDVPEEDDSDLSSDEDEADSDDIDSEGLAEEILGEIDQPGRVEISAQQDYIRF